MPLVTVWTLDFSTPLGRVQVRVLALVLVLVLAPVLVPQAPFQLSH